MLIFPPYWLIEADLRSTANAPTINITIMEITKKEGDQNQRSISNARESEKDLKGFLYDTVIKYGSDYEEMYKTIECESGWNKNAIGDDGASFGIAQYLKTTWNENCIGDYENPEDQIECMAQMFQKEKKDRWTCWRNLFKKTI